RLKWPNDLVIGDAKLGGVLVETSFEGKRLERVVVGVGINVNQTAEELPRTPYPATSLRLFLGRKLDRNALAGSLLAELTAARRRWRADHEGLHAEWKAALETLDQEVVIIGPTGKLEGRALDVGGDG